MFGEPRVYRDESDLESMRNLLRQGRLADNGAYYVHPGDLNWWLFYPPLEYDYWQSIYLWNDSTEDGQILGWALLSPVGATFDIVLRPELRDTPLAWQMYDWVLRQLTTVAKRAGREHIGVYWIAEQDALMRGWLVKQGFAQASRDVHLTCDLTEPGLMVPVPDGFVVRSSRGLTEVAQRAQAQYGAFNNTTAFESYLARFTRFMQSPVYNPVLDVVAVNPEGQIGAFCITWPDQTTGVGLFEPVGTHPDFQRRGLGKAVMLEALERLRKQGMRQAIVTTSEDNLPAIKLYESIGFRIARRLLYYKKMIM